MMARAEPARPEIASAWRRAALCGLDPGSVPSERDFAPVHRDTPLMVAAGPVLDGVVQRLEDSRFTLILADRHSRIVDRRFGQRHLSRALDDVLAVPGNLFSEETSGTNALATALEIGRGLTVHGEEHFFERLKVLTCYAGPIVHPVTGRVEGVLDITGYAQDVTPMMEPFVAFAIAAIEERLGQGHSRSQMRMLAAFQERTARTKRPVLVFGDGLTLANDPATAMLDGPAQMVLRELARSAAGRGAGRAALPTGAVVEFVCEEVDGVRNASIVELVSGPVERPVVPRRRAAPAASGPRADELARRRRGRASVVVSGEPGTGRSHVVRALAGDQPMLLLDGATLTVARLDELAAGAPPAGLVVVDHVELVPEPVAQRLGTVLDLETGWFALVSAPRGDLNGEHLAVLGRCSTHLDLLPLRSRRAEIPAIATELLAVLRPGERLHLAGSAVKALMAWTWPGNLWELRSVLESAATASAERGRGRVIAADDLPLGGRRSSRRPLSAMEQAEFDAISAALQRCGGNKTHAATELGIGRTTLYRRMRELDIA